MLFIFKSNPIAIAHECRFSISLNNGQIAEISSEISKKILGNIGCKSLGFIEGVFLFRGR